MFVRMFDKRVILLKLFQLQYFYHKWPHVGNIGCCVHITGIQKKDPLKATHRKMGEL
jgi:hypothetical protein